MFPTGCLFQLEYELTLMIYELNHFYDVNDDMHILFLVVAFNEL